MRQKFLLVFLTLSFCNLYAESETKLLLEKTDLNPENLNLSINSSNKTNNKKLDKREKLSTDISSIFTAESLKTKKGKKSLDKWIKSYRKLNYEASSGVIEEVKNYVVDNKIWKALQESVMKPSCFEEAFCSCKINHRRDLIIELVSLRDSVKNELENGNNVATGCKNNGLNKLLENSIKKPDQGMQEKEITLLTNKGTVITPLVTEDISQQTITQIEKLPKELTRLKEELEKKNVENKELKNEHQILSEKVAAMDLDGIRVEVENLKTTKVGIKTMAKFAYLVNSLMDAKDKESNEGRIISAAEWAQIIEGNKSATK